MHPGDSLTTIPLTVVKLSFCGFEGIDIRKLVFSGQEYKELTTIHVGKGCFKKVCEFVVDGLSSFESLRIGIDCFSAERKECDDDDDGDDGICRITNCPFFRHLEIGDRSFSRFKSFELSCVDSLQTIDVGGGCFRNADFSLKGKDKETKNEHD